MSSSEGDEERECVCGCLRVAQRYVEVTIKEELLFVSVSIGRREKAYGVALAGENERERAREMNGFREYSR